MIMNIKCSKDKMLTCLLMCGVLFQLTNGPTLGQVSSNRTVDWAAITRAYGAFLELPSDENAKIFLDTMPATAPENYNLAQEGRFLEFFTFYRNYPIFRLEIWAGSADATRAAVRLLNLTSSARHGEVITCTISHLIRINPNLFLEILSEYKDSSSFKIFHRQLVGSTDPAYVDRIAATKNELQLRISALEK